MVIGNGDQFSDYIKTATLFKDSGIRFIGWIDSNGKANDVDIPDIQKI